MEELPLWLGVLPSPSMAVNITELASFMVTAVPSGSVSISPSSRTQPIIWSVSTAPSSSLMHRAMVGLDSRIFLYLASARKRVSFSLA